MDIGPPELLIILAVVLVLFGGKKLPELARSLGKAKQEFQDGLDDKGEQHHAHAITDSTTPTAAATPAPTVTATATPVASAPATPEPMATNPVDDTGTVTTPTNET